MSLTVNSSAFEVLGLRPHAPSVLHVSVGELFALTFQASADHGSVSSYTARIRAFGGATVLATQALGKPTPDGGNMITVDLSSAMNGLGAGRYTVSILTTSGAVSTDSGVSGVVVVS